MREDFAATQAAFCREHCAVFEDTEENRLEYTPIFEEYTAALETAIDAHLTETVEGFDIVAFAESLGRARVREALEGEVFELLATLSSFEAFKELMLSYKAQEEGAADGSGLDLGVGLGFGVSVAAAPVVGDEQTDGEERPDLDDAVVVTAAARAESRDTPRRRPNPKISFLSLRVTTVVSKDRTRLSPHVTTIASRDAAPRFAARRTIPHLNACMVTNTRGISTDELLFKPMASIVAHAVSDVAGSAYRPRLARGSCAATKAACGESVANAKCRAPPFGRDTS